MSPAAVWYLAAVTAVCTQLCQQRPAAPTAALGQALRAALLSAGPGVADNPLAWAI